MSAWIGVDLDGTLAYYDEWVSATHIGAPVPAMAERVKSWLRSGYDVRIFTARAAEPDFTTRVRALDAIREWSRAHFDVALPVTNVKDFEMIELWDDRAVSVEANTGRQLAPSRRGLA